MESWMRELARGAFRALRFDRNLFRHGSATLEAVESWMASNPEDPTSRQVPDALRSALEAPMTPPIRLEPGTRNGFIVMASEDPRPMETGDKAADERHRRRRELLNAVSDADELRAVADWHRGEDRFRGFLENKETPAAIGQVVERLAATLWKVHLATVHYDPSKATDVTACEHCGALFIPAAGKSRRRFCTDSCRTLKTPNPNRPYTPVAIDPGLWEMVFPVIHVGA